MIIIRIICASLIFFCITWNPVSADEACNNYKPRYSVSGRTIDDPPNASSYLIDKKRPNRYTPDKAFDGKTDTSWVEGRSDDGVGESIAFHFGGIREIQILPGFGVKKFFKKNNRLKTAIFEIYGVPGFAASQCAASIGLSKKPVFRKILRFKDIMKVHAFSIDIGNSKKYKHGYIGVLIIKEVYRGSRWRDTCIAEIGIKK